MLTPLSASSAPRSGSFRSVSSSAKTSSSSARAVVVMVGRSSVSTQKSLAHPSCPGRGRTHLREDFLRAIRELLRLGGDRRIRRVLGPPSQELGVGAGTAGELDLVTELLEDRDRTLEVPCSLVKAGAAGGFR